MFFVSLQGRTEEKVFVVEHYGQYIVTRFTLNRNSTKNKRFYSRHVTN